MSLTLKRIGFTPACEYVHLFHRHHEPPAGHRFSLAAWRCGLLVGVAIIGRPVSKAWDEERVVEVTRCCVDGTPNACSFLYGAAARAAFALGFERIQTYTLVSEAGASLRGAGWVLEAETDGGQWTRGGDYGDAAQGILFERNREDQPTEPKRRWAKMNPALAGAPASADRGDA
ncbi:MAG TPA: XF1762 family protein [Phycisphaerales bacterium]|nr:XF1762 family protein [Phycisphaerales bacterium]